MKDGIKEEKIILIIQFLVVIIFAAVSFSLCFSRDIWTDEAFTMQLLRENGFLGILYGTAADVHPPLYYFIAKIFWLLFGPSLFVQKIVGMLPVILLMLISIFKLKKLFGCRAGLIFLFYLASFPMMFEYTIQVRMYTWGMLFVTLCGIYSYEAYTEASWKKYAAAAAAAVAAGYTHYFALVNAAVIYGLLFIALVISKRKELKKWLVMLAVMVLTYVPWLLILLKQTREVAAGNIFPDIEEVTVSSCLNWLFGADIPYAVIVYGALFLIAGFFMFHRIKENRDHRDFFAVCCILVPVCTILAGVCFSEAIRHIFNVRYLFPAVAMLVLGFSIAMRELKKSAYIFLCLFFMFIGVVQFQKTWEEEFHSTKVAETEAFFKENLGADDIILYNFTGYGFIYEFYWPKEQVVYLADMDFSGEYNTIWYLDTYNHLYLSEETLKAHDLTAEAMGNYGIEHNQFKIYKITRRQ